MTAELEVFAELSYAHNKQVFQIQPVPISDQFAIAATDPLLHDPRNPTAFPYIMPSTNPLFALTGGSPLSTIVIHPGSPYYPTAYVQSQVGAGNPLPDILVRYRSFGTGPRSWVDVSEPKRGVVGVKGTVADWDYEASVLDSESRVAEQALGGIPEFSKIMPLLNSGNVNFWGPNTPQIAQELLATDFTDYAYKTKTSLRGVNAKVSRDVLALPGGTLAAVIGSTNDGSPTIWHSAAATAGRPPARASSSSRVARPRRPAAIADRISVCRSSAAAGMARIALWWQQSSCRCAAQRGGCVRRSRRSRPEVARGRLLRAF